MVYPRRRHSAHDRYGDKMMRLVLTIQAGLVAMLMSFMAAYRLRPGVPLLLVKDREGGIKYHYNNPPARGATAFGPEIAWLNDVQKAHFLRLGLVEEFDDSDSPVPDTLALRTGGAR
jgi:hypothetical protein